MSQATSNPELVSEFAIKVFNDSENNSKLNLTATISKPLTKMVIFLTIVERFESRDEQELLKGTVDMCKLGKGVFMNLMGRHIFNNFENHSNFPFNCPLRPGFYHVTNFPAMDDSFVPALFARNVKWEANAIVKGKTAKMKTFANMASVKLHGLLVK